MADRIAVMFDGRILQVAPPEELYESPTCRRVADFIGTMNLLAGRVLSAETGGLRLEAEGLGEIRLPHDGAGADGEVGLAVRPEKVQLSREAPGDGLIAARGRIAQIAYFGDASRIYVDTEQGVRIACHRPNRRRAEAAPLTVGEPCWVAWRPDDCILLTE
jgi:ABC-type Fe3+/spermidine/putrescine transport system ATPase subunit